MTRGIVLRVADAEMERQAQARHVPVTVHARGPLPYDRSLLIADGVRVPWERLETAFALLERWDALCPLGKPGLLLAEVGTPTERKYTEAVVRDLRIPVFEPGMLFVRNSAEGQALVDHFTDERGEVADRQLAFARALYKVKPRLCPLPQVWVHGGPAPAAPDPVEARPRRWRGRSSASPLVTVEISPGRCVKCHPGDEEKVRQMYAERGRRRGRR